MSSCPPLNPIPPVLDASLTPSGALCGLGISPSTATTRVLRTWIIERGDLDPVGSIERIIAAFSDPGSSNHAGWFMMLGYELGYAIEPKARIRPDDHRNGIDFPLAVIQRWQACDEDPPTALGSYTIASPRSSMGRTRYIESVERTKAYIAAGDIYQANIAHHLCAPFSGSTRACFNDLASAADPRLGSMMIFEHKGIRHAICSISPELFLEYTPHTRMIRTEPMKGTRPIGTDEAELRDSIKDKAELDMITDLMRNDLGRICTLGSVRVVDPRRIESHRSGVLQATAAIEGQLRDSSGLGDIIRATFPPGSITGAPKVRAMQIIDELESTPRNTYCGSMVVMNDQGALKSSVSIRTAHIWGEPDPDQLDSIIAGTFDYAVGAGLVADSDPAEEWAETLTKASVLRSALGVELGS